MCLVFGGAYSAQVFVTIGPPEILEKHGIDEFANFPRLAPNGKVRAIRARDVVGAMRARPRDHGMREHQDGNALVHRCQYMISVGCVRNYFSTSH